MRSGGTGWVAVSPGENQLSASGNIRHPDRSRGIKVATVELKHIDLPTEMQRSMAKQAEAERERRAKIINAEGEQQAASKLAEASKIIREHPMALQLWYLQTMREMSAEQNTTIVFPFPIDFFKSFIDFMNKDGKGRNKQSGFINLLWETG
jgi:hypothetical protein